jgi:uncharacterized protein YdiU (UPF0061 family)
MIQFQNTYTDLPEEFYQRVLPAKFSSPSLIAFNQSLANELKINYKDTSEEELAKIFSGQTILDGSDPIAMAYAGFQFGHPSPQLGDGRAHLLGETQGFDIQLKGSGQTRFSRRGDGKSALGPVLREFIVSEAMHALGVPTTRALCAVASGEHVYRQDGPEPGGVFTRVAASHLRVGTFQYFFFQKDIESMKTLLNYTINRHYPELQELESYKEKSLELLKALTFKQASLVAKWSSLGFIHGVMNTDNFSLAGITIDYGPCAFMEEFNFHKVFSSIDHHKRYSYWHQIPIAQWNILRLADCLLPLIDDNQEKAIKAVEDTLVPLKDEFKIQRNIELAKKLGINDYQTEDEKLVMSFLKYLESEELDFTLSFRNLPNLLDGNRESYPDSPLLEDFLSKWKDRIVTEDLTQLNLVNPIYIPRNHQIQKAIDRAYKGDFEHFQKMLEVTQSPFETKTGWEEFALPAKEEEKIHHTFCGT